MIPERIWEWGREQEQSYVSYVHDHFHHVPPVLGFCFFSLPFEIHVEANQEG